MNPTAPRNDENSSLSLLFSPTQQSAPVAASTAASTASCSSATTTTTNTTTSHSSSCSYCSQTFETRNALFRHLRNDPICSLEHADDHSARSNIYSTNKNKQSDRRLLLSIVKESVALRFGYYDDSNNKSPKHDDGDDEEEDDDNEEESTLAETVGKVLQGAIVESLKEVVQNWYDHDTDTLEKLEIMGSTQASLAKLRRMALKQEEGCAANGDVLFVNLMLPKVIKKESMEKQTDFWTKVGNLTRAKLKHQIPQAELFDLQILGTKRAAKLHAEKSATQYIYHYLLPLSWLPEEDAMRAWWQSSSADDVNPTRQARQFHQNKKLKNKPPDSLRRLKEALRSAESEKASPEQIRSDHKQHKLRLATGRFGALAARSKRPWHNFADPALKGNASPNNEPVWRAVDKARIVDFFVETPLKQDGQEGEQEERMVAIIEFRGDGFVKEQIRRIVGSAVAMTHSWLPPDFIALATNGDTAIETPLAPPNRLILSTVRYHFDELQSNGRPFFETHDTRQIVQLAPSEVDGIGWAMNALLERNEEQAKLALENESMWLKGLSQEIAPRIRTELLEQGKVVASSKNPMNTSPFTYSKLYYPVLSELRRIKSLNIWPETSVARSTVILRQDKADDGSDSEHSSGTPSRQNGSFTIVNPKVQQNWDNLPLGNKLFPELVEAVFDLESNLAESENTGATHKITVEEVTTPASLQGRQPSSHCAVNCNAQFTPHVDSGRGAGQKLSMIVGLGDYVGGELRVEGDAFDIQYKPLVFDGWKLRHWTNPFAGERFSLVYFTPESKD
ncbi:unnamed protein product [Cylindrotheca closterium]|uniref:C2H2-type domain-containing protein n=1 Tax=Cylindrotheca closterium TaxID=2856 RepID=A0AAD2JJE0_9STRA|nr:unnamed protein product [Cylindrotheca closterium]